QGFLRNDRRMDARKWRADRAFAAMCLACAVAFPSALTRMSVVGTRSLGHFRDSQRSGARSAKMNATGHVAGLISLVTCIELTMHPDSANAYPSGNTASIWMGTFDT